MALPPPAAGSVALVTGASSGIGTEFARRLAGRGHDLVVVARRRERLERLADELRAAHGRRVEVIDADLADAGARDGLAARVDELGLAVEVLVNNAGFGTYGDFVDMDRERELEEVRVDVEAVVDLCGRWLPAMTQRGRGAVINMASTAGLQPLPGNATYAAAKAFVLAFSEGLHGEVGEHGVTVTAILPSPVRTEFQEVGGAEFAERLPGFVWVPAERVAEESLEAADRGKRTLIPGGPLVRGAFAPNRVAPRSLVLPIARRLMRKE